MLEHDRLELVYLNSMLLRKEKESKGVSAFFLHNLLYTLRSLHSIINWLMLDMCLRLLISEPYTQASLKNGNLI